MVNDQHFESNKVDYGFKKVDYHQKKNLVGAIFSDVAAKYDLMNDLMSLGIHRLWKNQLCRQVPDLNTTILDIASGTGDVAFKLLKKAKSYQMHPKIIISDINQEMINQAYDKALDQNLVNELNFLCADAEDLSIEDDTIDYYIIAFGIRNVTNISKALKEAYRVLKPGGKFLSLEFSKVKNENLRLIYDFYSFNIIPKIGKYITNNEEAYKYLVESISIFPDQNSFKELILNSGFANVNFQNLNLGIAAIHSGYKL